MLATWAYVEASVIYITPFINEISVINGCITIYAQYAIGIEQTSKKIFITETFPLKKLGDSSLNLGDKTFIDKR